MLRRYAPLRRCTRPRPKALKPKRGYVEDPAYRRWIHTQPCIVHDGRCGRWVEMHHVGRPRNDRRGLPLCAALHREGPKAVHQIGRRAFEECFRISFEAAIQGLNDQYELRLRQEDGTTQLTRKVARMNPPIPLPSRDGSAWVDGEEGTATSTGPGASEALVSLAERTDESTKHTTERSKAMAEYLRFSTNVPEEVALRFPEGKQVSSKIEGGADQMMYSLADGRVMYVPLHVADQIRELRIGPGERFNLGKFEVKESNRRFIRWQLARVDPDPRWQQPAPSDPNGSGTAASSRAAKPGEEAPAPASANTPPQTNTPSNGNGTAKAPVNGNGHAVHNGIPYWDPKAELRHCYEDAIEVLVAARDIAAGKGLPVQFTGDDLRQVAATLYIGAGKDRRCPNGGAR